ncbi:hypothetical protein KPATCC21470_2137 [Kitasatospora purpeofusca]
MVRTQEVALTARTPRKERMRYRWRPVAVAVAAVVVAAVPIHLPAAAAAPAPSPTAASGPNAGAGSSNDPEVRATRAEASAEARRAGRRIEVGSARTEYTQVFANPSGTFTVEQAFQPQRVKVDGKWTAIDPTLRFAPDGSVRPAATPLGMSFSGGRPGQALAELNRAGRGLAFSWDVPLPVPTLAGPVATYANVLPDVDLVVTAHAEEFSEVLVVRTPEAARNPKLARLTFTTRGTGVTVRTEADGTLRAADSTGKEFFTGSQPLMWDSRADTGAKHAAAPEAAPDAGAETAPDTGAEGRSGTQPSDAPREARPMAATVSGAGADTKLTITPEQSLLTAPDTVFPVVIDPTFPGRLQNWTTAYKPTPNTGYWNGAGFNEGDGNSWTSVARVGHETDTNGTARSFFELDTTNLWDAGIIRSTFRLRATHSWSCTAKPITLYDTPKISASTNWNNSGGWWGYPVSTAKTGAGGGANCPGGDVEWDTTGPARLAAGNHWYNWSLGLRANDESTAYSWTKFQASSAILSTEANYPPETPDWLSTDPGTSCDGSVVLGDAPAVRLRARGQDRDGGTVKLYFRLYPTGGAVRDAGMVAVSAGNVGTLDVRTQDLPTGEYTWDVVAFDDAAWSGWSPACRFTIDRSRPSGPPVVTSTAYGPDPARTGPARGTGAFDFTANGVNDVARYEYWTEWDPDHRAVDAPCAGCNRSVSLRIPNPGPHTLSVRSKDRAGNYSDVATYDFWAKGSGAVDAPGDLDGDGKVDVLTTDPDGRLLFYPGTGTGLGTPARASRYTDTLPNNATAWKGNLLTSRGDWNSDGYADALVRRTDPTTGTVEMYLHPGLGDGRICVDKECSGYQRMPVRDDTNRARIAAATDLLAVDNATGDDTGLGLGYPDLLVLSGGELWLYQGDGSGTLDAAGRSPVLLGSGWADTTLSTPGDLTGDGRPEVWARNGATGALTQYSLTTAGSTLVLGPGTAVGGTFRTAAQPLLGSGGDLTGDGKPDLWARGADKHMSLYAGTGTGPGGGFGAAVPLADSVSLWTDCQTFSGLSVCGPILDKYLALGGPTGPLRNPVTGTTVTPDGIGRYVHFRSDAPDGGGSAGSVYWSPDTGAHFVNGNIRNKWAELGWEQGYLGYPAADEINIGGLGTSWISTFAGAPGATPGAITFTGSAGTHELHGAIYQRYLALGGHNVVGFPSTDETATPVKPGRYNHFVLPAGGTDPYLSIYWSQDTGAHEVHGDIRTKWSQLGWENSYLGFPTSDEFTVAAGRRSSFTGGYIRWNGIAGGSTDYHGGDERPMARTNVAGDFNGDGRDDVATFVDYGTCAMGIWTFTTGPDGKPANPVERKSWPKDWWCYGNAKYLAGDFNGDGRDDLAALYGYGDGRVKIFTWLARPDGSFDEQLGRDVPPGGWSWNAIKPVTGDFNGDHRDDIAFLYDYGNCDSGLFTLYGQTGGSFATELASYRSGAGNWCAGSSTLLAGDYDKDGRTDIGVMYDYGNGNARLWTFRARPDGGFNGASVAWAGGPNDWWSERAKYATGDFNGDGYADIGAVYSYPDGRVRFFTFTGRPDGTVNGFTGGWDIPPGNWDWNALTLTGGKYDGDNRADLTFMYNFGDTRFSLAVVPGRPDGTFTGNLPGWETSVGLW